MYLLLQNFRALSLQRFFQLLAQTLLLAGLPHRAGFLNHRLLLNFRDLGMHRCRRHFLAPRWGYTTPSCSNALLQPSVKFIRVLFAVETLLNPDAASGNLVAVTGHVVATHTFARPTAAPV